MLETNTNISNSTIPAESWKWGDTTFIEGAAILLYLNDCCIARYDKDIFIIAEDPEAAATSLEEIAYDLLGIIESEGLNANHWTALSKNGITFHGHFKASGGYDA